MNNSLVFQELCKFQDLQIKLYRQDTKLFRALADQEAPDYSKADEEEKENE